VNGNFETGTFDGWEVKGICSANSTIVHNGSYSAYVSDYKGAPNLDDWLRQNVSTFRLRVDSGIILQAWVYPLKVGPVGGQYPMSRIELWFMNESSMTWAFCLRYTWSNSQRFNTTAGVNFELFDWNVSQWNFLNRNVTADIYSYFGVLDFSNIALHYVDLTYHASLPGDPGGFYVDDISLTKSRLTVPDDYSTIQEAINAANDGDTIFVRNGTYSGIVVDKSLNIEGEDKYTTIIQGGSEPYGAGMRVLADNVRISKFTIQNARGPPIRVHGDEGPSYGNITISDNIMTGCGEPVRLINTSRDIISCNVIRDSSGGFGFDWANGNIVHNNTLINVGIGIVGGYPSYNNTFSENTIIGNSNAVSMNGIFDNNRFFHNSFINNTIQVAISPTMVNIWDDSYPSGGNYWSDYNGTDMFLGPAQDQLDSDGIGDTPYIIDENNTDHYPLMGPWTSPDAAVLSITSCKTIVGEGFSSNVTVFLENQGSKIEELNATFYANDTFIGYQTFMLRSNNSIIYSSDWDLASLAKGNYSLSVCIAPLESETDLNDNSLNGSWVFITIPGDLNGDKTVDIYDAIILANHFGLTRYHVELWDPNVDLKEDGGIDIYDAILLANNYEKSWT
jgi:hypothetical protein